MSVGDPPHPFRHKQSHAAHAAHPPHQVDVTGLALVGGQRITPQITADYRPALDITSAGLMSSSERHEARKQAPTTRKTVQVDSLCSCDQNAPCLMSYIMSVARLR